MKKLFAFVLTSVLVVSSLSYIFAKETKPITPVAENNENKNLTVTLTNGTPITYEIMNVVEVEKDSPTPNTEKLEEFGKISVKQGIIIDGEENLFYPTFDNQSTSLANVKAKFSVLLEKIAKQYGLGELSEKNWEKYWTAINDYRGGISKKETSTEFQDCTTLCGFFDIYENFYENEKILDLASKAEKESLQEEEAMDFIQSLPNTQPAHQKYTDAVRSQKMEKFKDKDETDLTEGAKINVKINEDITVEYQDIQVIDIEETFSDNGKLQEFGDISTKQALLIDGQKNPLFCTFDDPKVALENLKTKFSDLLRKIQEEYSFLELDETNWRKYQAALYDYRETCVQDKQTFQDCTTICSFFDIYENDETNAEILSLTAVAQAGTMEEEEAVEWIHLLPYQDVAYQKYYTATRQKATTSSVYDYQKAVQYAKQYAELPNYAMYYVYEADCTNFISQAVRNGDYPMNKYWMFYQKTSDGCTKAWRIADEFCGQFAIDYSTLSFKTFTDKLSMGDIMAYDEYCDGDWNHVAMATDIGSTTSAGYKNIRVAQHSSNYLKWIEQTGWPNLEGNATFGIIYRRYL